MLSSNRLRMPKQQGVTLIELVITIVVISIAAATLLQTLGSQSIRNVDPMIQTQAQLIAQQYLKEINRKSFFDPNADPRISPTLSRAAINQSIFNQNQYGRPNRTEWDNIYEYNGYQQTGIVNPDGTTNIALSSFSVSINVDMSSQVSLLELSNSSVANCPAQLARISVVVTDPRGNQTLLSGYRTSHWQPPASWGC